MDKTKEKKLMVFLNEFIRIKDVMRWGGISSFGFLLGVSSLNPTKYLPSFLLFFITTFCILSFTFAINNYYDAESDKENPRRKNVNAIASGKISKKTGVSLNIILALTPIAVSVFLGFKLLTLCLTLVFLMWIYSAPPLRLKGRPGLDIMWHFSAFFLLVIWGSLFAGSLETIHILTAASIGVFSCIGQIGNHIEDYKYDKESGTTTLAVKLGVEKTKRVLNGFTATHLILLTPLILLYTIKYYTTMFFFLLVAVAGFLILRPKKGFFPTKRCYTYYFAVVLGGAVYGSCLIYRLNSLLNVSPPNPLKFLGML
ncbi:MAG: hypothetical protein DRN01_01665 [Thermoplasmata archaeon]|nr:MAG: hypothetical protein DRN01_01665 [Thermoplasmata archaeon]